MRFAQRIVFAHVDRRSVRSVTAAVENRAERRGVVTALIVITHAEECLIVLARVPVDAAIPLHGIVQVVAVYNVVVIGLAAIGVGQWVKIEKALCDGIDLSGAEHVLLAIAGQKRR